MKVNGNTTAPPYPVKFPGITTGSTVTLEAVPASGYFFSYWSGDVEGTANPTTLIANCDKIFTANFTTYTPPATLTVSVSVSPASSGAVKVNGTTSSPPYPARFTGIRTGSTVTLEALPASGYSFSNWSGDVTGTANPTTLYADRSKTITANFTTYTPPPPGEASKLYFPHVASGTGSAPLWETEVCVINTGNQAITGILKSYQDNGQEASANSKTITLAAHGRWSRIVGAGEFTNPSQIGYMIFESNSDSIVGYVKFYREGLYRAAVPAVKEVNTSITHVPHIASNAQWWTGMSLVNTTGTAKTLFMIFSDGQRQSITLAAGQHKVFQIRDLFNGQPQPDIESAMINNTTGVIGLLLFGTGDGSNLLDGIPLTSNTAMTLFYPHVASDNIWWTGIVAYNTLLSPSDLTITSYNAQGMPLSSSTLSIAGRERFFGLFSGLGLPAETAWFRIDSTRPLSGFELFATYDGNQLAAYSDVGGAGTRVGVFPKIEKEKNGWTGIAFVNPEATVRAVTLTAYNDSGAALATRVLSVGANAKEVYFAEDMFTESISNATYIAYSADSHVVGFQLNGNGDGTMLDGLPILSGTNY